jgi:hypothetical protein
MSVRVQVTNQSNDRPLVNAEVIVKWVSGGISNRRTNQNGVADLDCSGGTLEYVRVNGREVLGRMSVGDNDTIEVRGY